MKPKDLKCPFRWDQRRPVLFDRVLFVPQYYDRHAEWVFPGWESASLFGNSHPISVEYCSGNGDWIVAKAIENPLRNWIAVEKRFDRVRKIWSKMRNHKVNNLLIVSGEAQAFSRYYLPSSSVEEVYVNFPDPWPKRGHAKHRLIQAPFIEEMARLVQANGRVVLVTDDPDYSLQMIQEMNASKHWVSLYPDPFYMTDWPGGYGGSYFEALWRSKGCRIHYHIYHRQEV